MGKRSARYDRRDLLLESYLTHEFPKPPLHFGHETLVDDWGVLGNDKAGDCVFAGAAHETMLWAATAGHELNFTTEAVLRDYAAVTGYDPVTGANDEGTLVRDALNYRKNVGILDETGARHKILGYVALEPGNLDHLYAAMYIFGAVGIGIQFPESAMAQFNAGKPWTVVAGAQIEGGHYVPLIAKRLRLKVVTWGKLQKMTTAFYSKYVDEAYAILDDEMLVEGKSVEGFVLQELLQDLKAIGK